MTFISRVIHYLLTQPPHPLFVHFPIALTGAGLFFILLALWKKNEILEKAAFANISLAAASTLVAAIVGIRDNLAFYNGGAPNHITKIILASVLLIVTTLTAITRWKNKDLFTARKTKGLYIAAYFVSFAVAAVLGFLGGIIIYGF
jgi:uncharacterized membrane protein